MTLGELKQGLRPDHFRLTAQFAARKIQSELGLLEKTGIGFATPSDFGRYWMGSNWREGRHFTLWDRYLLDLEARRIEKLLLLAPVQHGKSKHIGCNFVPWYLSRHPRHKVMLGSYNETFAKSKSGEILEVIKGSQDALGMQLKSSNPAAGAWELISGGEMRAVGMDSGITGYTADLFVIDDPLKGAKQAFSAATLKAVEDTYLSCVNTRLSPKALQLCIMAHWQPEDLAGYLMKNELGWAVVVLPAEAEAHHPLIDGPDPLGREPGEPLWPEAGRDQAFLHARRGNSPQSTFWYNAMYQQRPQRSRPEHSGFIKLSWLEACAQNRFDLLSCQTCGSRIECQHKRLPNKAHLEHPTDIGLDVAHSPEGDRVVWAFARAGKIIHTIVKPGQRVDLTIGDTVAYIKEAAEMKQYVRSLRIDNGGVGAGVVDGLFAAQDLPDAPLAFRNCEILPVEFGGKSFKPDRFHNWRTEAWWHIAEEAQNGRLDLPFDSVMFEELSAPAMHNSNNGRLLLESKPSMLRRGIRSPDIGDAVVLALYPQDWFSRVDAW
jgi:hypothetical protein